MLVNSIFSFPTIFSKGLFLNTGTVHDCVIKNISTGKKCRGYLLARTSKVYIQISIFHQCQITFEFFVENQFHGVGQKMVLPAKPYENKGWLQLTAKLLKFLWYMWECFLLHICHTDRKNDSCNTPS